MSGRGAGRGGRGGGGRTGAGRRGPKTQVKTGKRRSASSTLWLTRQLNDRFVAEAQERGYRSRAAFKLAQIDDKFRVLTRGAHVVDLGAAPGGWTQVAVERCGPAGRVVAVDLSEIEPLSGAVLVQGDVREEDTLRQVRDALAGSADLVLSDMAAPATGHAKTDHLRVMALVETALDVAEVLLAPGGAFVAKVLIGGTESALLDRLKRAFAKVRHVKPPASRAGSAEMYLVATGYRGAAPAE